jgi:hypothetical protein
MSARAIAVAACAERFAEELGDSRVQQVIDDLRRDILPPDADLGLGSISAIAVGCLAREVPKALTDLGSLREFRPIGGDPKPRLSIDRLKGAFCVPSAVLRFAAIVVCV